MHGRRTSTTCKCFWTVSLPADEMARGRNIRRLAASPRAPGALSIAEGAQKWNNSTPLPWDEEVARFFAAAKRLDDYLASDAPIDTTPERLFQGAIADALTHVGQIAMLRRIAGCPIKAENYYQADIVAGRVGAEQTAPRREF